MRRRDREITERRAIADVIESCQCCRLGFCDNGEVYIVPLNFGFEYQKEQPVFYFHGAKEGRKIGLIEKDPRVGFEMDTGHEVYAKGDPKAACTYTARFQSIIGTGKVSMVPGFDEKKHGLELLMQHAAQTREWSFDEKMLNAVAVFKLEVDSLSCKAHE